MGAQKLFSLPLAVVWESESGLPSLDLQPGGSAWFSAAPAHLEVRKSLVRTGLDWTASSICLTQLAGFAKVQTHCRTSKQSGGSICVIVVINEEINGFPKRFRMGSAAQVQFTYRYFFIHFMSCFKKINRKSWDGS